MVWNDQEKAFAVLTFNKTGSFVQTLIEFRKKFKTRKSPAKNRIQSWLKKFTENGTIKNSNKCNSGKICSARTEANIALLQVSVEASPKTSPQRRVLTENLQISHERFRLF